MMDGLALLEGLLSGLLELLSIIIDAIGDFFRGARCLWIETQPRAGAELGPRTSTMAKKLRPAPPPTPKPDDGKP
jgi:hypothetical protein